MEKNINIKIMGVFASMLLLVIIVTASFAYFGSFNVNLNNNVAVNINSSSPGDAVFTSNATQLNLQVPAANMSQIASNNEVAAATNTATLTVNLTGAANLLTTCTYDIVYEYDAGSNVYGKSPTTKNGNKEITLQVSNVNGTNNFANEKNFDFDSSWTNNKRTLVSGATISSDGTLTTQNISITGKYYNLTIPQTSIEGKAFTGKIYVTNHSCSTSELPGIPITSLMSTSTQDVHNSNGFRYKGANPNNYVCLDNQKSGGCSDSSLLFRIIGLFDEEYSLDGTNSSGIKKLLKVLDTNGYGRTDGKKWGSSNNWSSSTLNTSLNSDYINSIINLNSKLTDLIVNAKWHLGSIDNSSYSSSSMFALERAPYNTSGSSANLISGNPETIYAKIGIIYPSDFAYSFKYDIDFSQDGVTSLVEDSWIYNNQTFVVGSFWTISPGMMNDTATLIASNGNITSDHQLVMGTYGINPTFYLDAEAINIVGGTGTSTDPYHIG